MSSSTFNLLPWRERQRSQALSRWRWGLTLSLCMSWWGVQWLDQWLDAGLQQQIAQRQAWQNQVDSLQAALADAPLWTQRQQEAAKVKAQWMHWQDLQSRAWREMGHVLAVSPRGVQVDHVVWREQQLQLNGWAVSAAHLQLWQDQLQAQRTDWEPAVWRETNGWGLRQHRFGLSRPGASGS